MTKEEYQKKASAVEKLTSAAGIKDLWNGLTEEQRNAIIGGGIGTAAGAGLGALSSDENRGRNALIGAAAGGAAGAGAGYYGTQYANRDPMADAYNKAVEQLKILYGLTSEEAQKMLDEANNSVGVGSVAAAGAGGYGLAKLLELAKAKSVLK
jgi:hypothetical protein